MRGTWEKGIAVLNRRVWEPVAAHYSGAVTIRLYDTSARQIRDFVPLKPGCVSIYLCGATVQAAPTSGTSGPG